MNPRNTPALSAFSLTSSQGFLLRLGGVGLLAALIVIAGCNRQAKRPPAPGPAEVEVAYPIERRVTDFEEFSGRTEADKTVELRARVTGYLDKVFSVNEQGSEVGQLGKEYEKFRPGFKEGGLVEEGQPLFLIDPRPYRAELDKAEANVVQAEAHLKRLEADYRRAVNLRARAAMGREEFDRIIGDRDEAQAALQSARATRDSTRLNLDYTLITAPFAGRISRTSIDRGNLVQSNLTPLTTIVTVNPMKAVFDSDERTVLRVRRMIGKGEVTSATEKAVPVFMALADEDTFIHKGTVDFVDNKVDPNTGTLRLRGVFENRDNVLTPGLFVRVRVPVGDPKDAILITDRAISSDQGRKFVYVVKKEKRPDAKTAELVEQEIAEARDIITGAPQEGGLRAVKEGLKVTDRVIVTGLQRVRPGFAVKVLKEKKTEPDLTASAGDSEASTGAAGASSSASRSREGKAATGRGAGSTSGGKTKR